MGSVCPTIKSLWVHILIVSTALQIIKGAIVVPPINEAEKTSVTLKCGVSVGTQIWYECTTSACAEIGSNGVLDYQGSLSEDIFTLVSIPDNGSYYQYDLTVSPLLGATGRYRCFSSDEQYAEIILIDADTTCLRTTPQSPTTDTHEVEEGQMMTVACSVGYSGRWGPRIDITRDGNAIPGSGNTLLGQASYSSSMLVTRSDTGQLIGSETYFTDPTDAGVDEADNAPGYQYVYIFPDNLVVYYGCDADMEIGAVDPEMAVGATISCSGGTCNPSADNHTWVDASSGLIAATGATEALLIITIAMAGANNSYFCSVSNTFFDTKHPVASAIYNFYVPVPTTTTPTTADPAATTPVPTGNSTTPGLTGGEIAGITIGVIVFVALVILLVLFLIYWCRGRTPKDTTDSKSKTTNQYPKPQSTVTTSPTGRAEDDGGFQSLYSVKPDANGQPMDFSKPPMPIDNVSIGYGDVSHYDDVPGNRRPLPSNNVPQDGDSVYSGNNGDVSFSLPPGAHGYGYDNPTFEPMPFSYSPQRIATPDTAV